MIRNVSLLEESLTKYWSLQKQERCIGRKMKSQSKLELSFSKWPWDVYGDFCFNSVQFKKFNYQRKAVNGLVVPRPENDVLEQFLTTLGSLNYWGVVGKFCRERCFLSF